MDLVVQVINCKFVVTIQSIRKICSKKKKYKEDQYLDLEIFVA